MSSNMIKNERRHITSIRNETGAITTVPANMNRIFREYYERLINLTT